jgi:hypothetical protein
MVIRRFVLPDVDLQPVVGWEVGEILIGVWTSHLAAYLSVLSPAVHENAAYLKVVNRRVSLRKVL